METEKKKEGNRGLLLVSDKLFQIMKLKGLFSNINKNIKWVVKVARQKLVNVESEDIQDP